VHEVSIANSVIDYITTYEKENNFVIKKIIIEAGKGSGTSVEALGFCLGEMMKAMRRDIIVEFVEPGIRGLCGACGKEVTLEYPTYVCPVCGSLSLDIVSGMGLNIFELEGDEIES
jgi:hydrogenase nickel incorporation protein HypA/HybF